MGTGHWGTRWNEPGTSEQDDYDYAILLQARQPNQCEPGQALEVDACVPCEHGRYSAASSAECLPCPAGKYTDVAGSDDCISCGVRWREARCGYLGEGFAECGGNCVPIAVVALEDLGFDVPIRTVSEQNIAMDAGSGCDLLGDGFVMCSGVCVPLEARGVRASGLRVSADPGYARLTSHAGSSSFTECGCEPGYFDSDLVAGNEHWTCAACAVGKYIDVVGSDAPTDCIECVLGRYVDVSGSGDCIDCAAGKYIDGTGSDEASDCISCVQGRYVNVSGSGDCIDCAAGKFVSASGSNEASDCISCRSGRYVSTTGSTGQADCIRCARGKFAGTTGNVVESNCTLCQAGKYNSRQGQARCISCPAGTYLESVGSDTSSDCTDCAQGRYSEVLGAMHGSSCTCCAAGKVTDRAGSASISECLDCVRGKWSDNACAVDGSENLCEDCPVDFYGVLAGATTEQTACIQCPLQSTTEQRTGADALMECWCEAGFQMRAGACEECPYDTFKTLTSPDSCTPCPSNSVTDGVIGAKNVTECLCVAGYSGSLSHECGVDCITGECSACSEVYYKTGVGPNPCIACPANALSLRSSTSITDCICDVAS